MIQNTWLNFKCRQIILPSWIRIPSLSLEEMPTQVKTIASRGRVNALFKQLMSVLTKMIIQQKEGNNRVCIAMINFCSDSIHSSTTGYLCDMKQMTMKNSIPDIICQLLQNLIKCIILKVKWDGCFIFFTKVGNT